MIWRTIKNPSLQVRFNVVRLFQLVVGLPLFFILMHPLLGKKPTLFLLVPFIVFLGPGIYRMALRCPKCGYRVGRNNPTNWNAWRFWCADKCCQCGHDISGYSR
jgi:hypothetical protein